MTNVIASLMDDNNKLLAEIIELAKKIKANERHLKGLDMQDAPVNSMVVRDKISKDTTKLIDLAAKITVPTFPVDPISWYELWMWDRNVGDEWEFVDRNEIAHRLMQFDLRAEWAQAPSDENGTVWYGALDGALYKIDCHHRERVWDDNHRVGK